MPVLDHFNMDKEIITQDTSLAFGSMRELFLDWLVDGNVKKYSVETILSCLDKVSDYSIQKKISTIGIWEYMQFNAFNPIYNKLLESKLLRVTDRNTYKVFTVAGQLYRKFLKEKPWKQKLLLKGGIIEESEIKEQIDVANQTYQVINPEDVIKWLITQPNTNGTLYLEHVVRQYMRSLHSAPMKLSLTFLESRDVFACRTVDELDKLWSIFKTDPNYKKVNSTTSGMFSAGLGAYRRYLENIVHNDNQSVIVHSEEALKQESAPLCSETLVKTLEKHFPNGFRNNSPIEMRRYRRFILEDYSEDIMLSDEEIDNLILSFGTFFEGKVYIVKADAKEKIKKMINSAVNEGIKIVFYNAFYERNEDWLFPASIISEEMLKSYLMNLYPQFIYKKNYLEFEMQSGNELAKIECEVLRVWGSDVLLSFEQLSECLPYIPVDKIKYTLSQREIFIWNAEGVYTHIGKVDITAEEYTFIADFVSTAYLKDGYASLSDIPLYEIAERNYKLSLTAIHNAVFAIVLADNYDKRGKIVIRKGDILDALSIVKEYCRSLERCLLRDLLDFERGLTGEIHRWIPMEAGYGVMIRINEDTFLAEKYVYFNVSETDKVLDRFVEGNYLTLRSIANFSVFPDCGQAWNLFLLESYCRRFSDSFSFKVLAVNSKNAGVIVRKNYTASYIEIMADAVASSNVVLEKVSIEEFLCNNGYIGRRSYNKTNELIELANAIRERED